MVWAKAPAPASMVSTTNRCIRLIGNQFTRRALQQDDSAVSPNVHRTAIEFCYSAAMLAGDETHAPLVFPDGCAFTGTIRYCRSAGNGPGRIWVGNFEGVRNTGQPGDRHSGEDHHQ